MRLLPRINNIPRTQVVTDVFRGYVNRLKVGDGEWNYTEGITLEEFPVLASRRPRGLVGRVSNPQGMIGKDALAYVDGGTLFYNGLPVTLPAGVSLSSSGKKQIVGMGAYICIFPDKVYYNTQDSSDAGYMEAYFEVYTPTSPVTYEPCRANGEIYEDVFIADSAPSDPSGGDYWLDTSSDTHSLKIYSDALGTWSSIPTVYTRISAPNIGAQFKLYDGITLSGISYGGIVEDLAQQAEALNGDKVLYSVGTDWIVVQGLIDGMFQQTSGTVKAERTVPSMDYITESENRLWGCKYGMVGSKVVNEIYACKLGDFRNWRCYMGLSTDSYAVSLGSDGQFTGAITYQGSPHFFKEGAIHKVYGSAPSNYQIMTGEYRGVQHGCSESLTIVGTTLYYKSRVDVCAYDGSAPQSVSEDLGETKYMRAVGGAWDGKLVMSMQDEDDAWHTFVYDTQRSMWIRDGGQQIVHATSIGEELYYIDSDGNLWSAGGTDGQKEINVKWCVESGLQYWQYTKHKRVSRYNIRMKVARGAMVKAYMEYDSNGTWHESGVAVGTDKTDTYHMFIIPRRCDHMRLKLVGYGRTQILSIARIVEEASDL